MTLPGGAIGGTEDGAFRIHRPEFITLTVFQRGPLKHAGPLVAVVGVFPDRTAENRGLIDEVLLAHNGAGGLTWDGGGSKCHKNRN